MTLSVVACSAKNAETPNTTDADTDTEETAIPQTGVPGVKYEAESLAFSKMEDRYGILPMPKYDTVQTEYYTGSQEGYFSFAIPITTKNPDMAGAVLEALASYSYRATTPTYCDVVLKGAYMNDVQARAAMDTLINGISIDTATLYMHTVGASFVFDIRNYLNSELNVDYLEELNLRLNSLNGDLKAYKILYGRGKCG